MAQGGRTGSRLKMDLCRQRTGCVVSWLWSGALVFSSGGGSVLQASVFDHDHKAVTSDRKSNNYAIPIQLQVVQLNCFKFIIIGVNLN